MDNVSGSLAKWAMGEAEVVEQVESYKLTDEELLEIHDEVSAITNKVSTLYGKAFIKELNDCRIHLKNALHSVKQLKERVDYGIPNK